LSAANLRVEGNHAPFELQAELLGDGFGEIHFEAGQFGAVIIIERLKAPFGGRNDGAGLLIASHSRAWDGPPIISESGMTTLNNLARKRMTPPVDKDQTSLNKRRHASTRTTLASSAKK
jgi:hypothetical protein